MSERIIRSNDVDLCVETFGHAGDPAVLLIHGAQASMLWWEEDLCSAIAAGGRFVIRFDNRDTGRSVSYPPGRPPYAMSDLAADAVGILDALDIDRAHVVGRSMAGGIALFLGVDHPSRVETITLVATTTGDDDLPSTEDEVVDDSPMPEAGDVDGMVEYAVGQLRICAGRSPYFDEAAVRARAARDVARAADMAATLTNHWVMRFDSPVNGGWGDLRVPVLVVHGEVDPYFPLPHGVALAAAIPGADLVVMPHVGHDLPPQAWNQVVPILLRHTDPEQTR